MRSSTGTWTAKASRWERCTCPSSFLATAAEGHIGLPAIGFKVILQDLWRVNTRPGKQVENGVTVTILDPPCLLPWPIHPHLNSVMLGHLDFKITNDKSLCHAWLPRPSRDEVRPYYAWNAKPWPSCRHWPCWRSRPTSSDTKSQRIGPGSCHCCQVLKNSRTFGSNIFQSLVKCSRCSRCLGCSQLSEAHSNYRITNQIIPFFRLKRTSMWLTWKAMRQFTSCPRQKISSQRYPALACRPLEITATMAQRKKHVKMSWDANLDQIENPLQKKKTQKNLLILDIWHWFRVTLTSYVLSSFDLTQQPPQSQDTRLFKGLSERNSTTFRIKVLDGLVFKSARMA